VDDIGTIHSVRVKAESLYEATLLGLNALSRVGWESDGDTAGEFARGSSLRADIARSGCAKVLALAQATWSGQQPREAEAGAEKFDEMSVREA